MAILTKHYKLSKHHNITSNKLRKGQLMRISSQDQFNGDIIIKTDNAIFFNISKMIYMRHNIIYGGYILKSGEYIKITQR